MRCGRCFLHEDTFIGTILQKMTISTKDTCVHMRAQNEWKKHKWYISGVHNIVVLSIWFFSWDTFSDLKYIHALPYFSVRKKKERFGKIPKQSWLKGLNGQFTRVPSALYRFPAPSRPMWWVIVALTVAKPITLVHVKHRQHRGLVHLPDLGKVRRMGYVNQN